MLALSIRQPYAELILRGIKTVEYRSRATRIIGERFHIYASKGSGVRVQGSGKTAWSRDLGMADEKLPGWMIELAQQVGMIEAGELGGLPRGVIVGSAVIERVEEMAGGRHEGTEARRHEGGEEGAKIGEFTCSLPPRPSLRASVPSSLRASLPPSSLFAWHLADIQRAKTFRKPRRHPQPVWFTPF